MKTTFLLVLVLVFIGSSPSWAAGKSPRHEKLGYRDDDNDGKNDLFRDQDGDGINDVTGKPYRHRYLYNDSDGDGQNDNFRDADGNGINDLMEQDAVRMGGMSHFVIDFEENGINDVTGKQYQQHMGMRGFFDENGDGIRDTRKGEFDSQFRSHIKGNIEGKYIFLDPTNINTIIQQVSNSRVTHISVHGADVGTYNAQQWQWQATPARL